MKIRATIVATALVAGLFATRALAQHEEHHAAPPAAKADAAKKCEMMSGDTMSTMHQTMTAHMETGALVEQLLKNFEAIEAQNDPETANPATLKEKLAEHGKLLRELRAKTLAQFKMMDKMMDNAKASGSGK